MAVFLRSTETGQLEERWRIKLHEIRCRYEEERKPEIKSEYLRVLKQFTDLVLRGTL